MPVNHIRPGLVVGRATELAALSKGIPERLRKEMRAPKLLGSLELRTKNTIRAGLVREGFFRLTETEHWSVN